MIDQVAFVLLQSLVRYLDRSERSPAPQSTAVASRVLEGDHEESAG